MKASATGKELTFNRQFVCRLKDSTVYTMKIAQKDDKTFITCRAGFTDKTPVTKEEGSLSLKRSLRKRKQNYLPGIKRKSFLQDTATGSMKFQKVMPGVL